MTPEHHHLLRDLLHEDTDQRRRAVVLEEGGGILRRKRLLRFTARSGMIVAIIVLVMAVWRLQNAPPPVHLMARTQTATDARVTYLTDDELLSLFPGTPVALATIHGQKRLFFPRSGDEARFISRRPTTSPL